MRACVALALIAGVGSAGASTVLAHEPFVPTPSQLYGRLFVRVHMAALRPGGDNFVDDIPKASPLVIMRRYRAGRCRTGSAGPTG